MTTHAVILAGGRGSRLGGVRKADLIIGGQRLLDRVTSKLRGIDGTLLVSTGRHTGITLAAGSIGLADADIESRGPLAGIAAAAEYLRRHGRAEDGLLSVAVDTPFLPEDYLFEMTQGDGQAACAAFEPDIYPTNAYWPVGALWQALRTHEPDTGPRTILSALNARRVDWGPSAPENPFASLNSLADLIALQRRATPV